MAKQISHSPLLYDYLRKYQEDPTSRVFAPLAEAYRKAGMMNEAIEIAREGLRIHPNFLGGRVALARALFDKKLYTEVIDELAPIIQDAPDNLVAQRLLAESYLIQGRVTEALDCYKMLLYFNPHDPETSKLVKELEAQAYDKGAMVLRIDPKPSNHDPALKRAQWIKKIEKLQAMLQQVSRYRTLARGHG
jgi:tetratricopeptide (TPR) repeat protein